MMEHECVAIRVGEERHVADAGVECVTGELDASGLERGARRSDVLHVKREGIAGRHMFEAHRLGVHDVEGQVPDLELRVVALGPVARPVQPKRLAVERHRPVEVAGGHGHKVDSADHGLLAVRGRM